MQRLLPLLISTVLLGAQAPPDSTAYFAYVDILPASRTATITAIKDASRKDDGFQRIEFFEQGFPGPRRNSSCEHTNRVRVGTSMRSRQNGAAFVPDDLLVVREANPQKSHRI